MDVPAEVAALLAERAVCAADGQAERVEAIDEQLRLRGYRPDGEPLARPSPVRARRRDGQQRR
jgi:hypothetical protein